MAAETPVETTPELGKVRAIDFTFAQAQISLFTPDEEASSAKLSRDLVPKWEGLFDGERFILPLGVPAPREVPRVILQAAAKNLRCEISSERISIFWQRTIASEDLPPEFVATALRLLREYTYWSRSRVGRLSVILTRFAPHPQPGLYLARHFCQARWLERPFNRPEHFELHAHKVFSLKGTFTVNSWVRNRTAMAGKPGETSRVISVEQDLNTLFEEAGVRSYTPPEIETFVSAALQEFDSILELYYPSESES